VTAAILCVALFPLMFAPPPTNWPEEQVADAVTVAPTLSLDPN
jgi:hypothetical protein